MFTDTSKIADARGGEISMLDLWGQWQSAPATFNPKHPGSGGGAFISSMEKREGAFLVRLTLTDGRSLVCGEGSRLALDSGGWAGAGLDHDGLTLRTDAGPVAVQSMEPAGLGDVWMLTLSSSPHMVLVDGVWFVTE